MSTDFVMSSSTPFDRRLADALVRLLGDRIRHRPGHVLRFAYGSGGD
jgi:hypothetical protein